MSITSSSSEIHRAASPKPNCANCNKPITDTVVAAMGKSWHPEHFTCTHCGEPVEETAFRIENEKPYCEADYLKLFFKNCYACGERIKGTVLTALNETWHRECFKCSKCRMVIGLDEFKEKDGNPYCVSCGRPKMISKLKVEKQKKL